MMTMKRERLAFLDLEYGQIYGSYRRDLVPVEIGAVLWDGVGAPLFESKKIYLDCDLVMRKNIIDRLGNTIGVSERVANNARNEYTKRFDPAFELDEEAVRDIRKNVAYKSFRMLNGHVARILNDHEPSRLVFFSASQDLYILNKARVDLKGHELVDLQEEVVSALSLKNMMSLDRASRLIGFKTNWRYIRSENYTYPVPVKCRNFIKPHKAVGDAARIFLLYREFHEDKEEFLRRSMEILNAK
jgi:hypothetical protein